VKVISPGHSEAILEIESADKTVRILFDAWLSDFAFGDFMARNPRVDLATIGELDAVYISHAHCDHLDPYTLLGLFERPAVLVIPETIEFLLPLLSTYLPHADIRILRHNKPQQILGLTWTAFAFPAQYITNEEDVMTLVIKSASESVFLEADVALPDLPEAHSAVDKAMGNTERVFVSTRNELEALYNSYDAASPQDRKQKLAAYRRKRRQELGWEYARYAELDLPCPMRRGNLKLLTGQGMIFPPEIDPAYLKLSRPFPLQDVLAVEKEAARAAGHEIELMVLEPGECLDTKTRRKSKSSLKLTHAQTGFETAAEKPGARPAGPVFNEARDMASQKRQILSLLNDRFLPHQAYHREEPLKQLLLSRSSYTVRVRYGTLESHEVVDYRITFARFVFEEISAVAAGANLPAADEVYWANDLEDFLCGRQDQFSTTLHRFEEGTSIRLWTMLGLPFLNNDLVEKKAALHFKRAAQGLSVNDWLQSVRH
jgi:hypothetical protein